MTNQLTDEQESPLEYPSLDEANEIICACGRRSFTVQLRNAYMSQAIFLLQCIGCGMAYSSSDIRHALIAKRKIA